MAKKIGLVLGSGGMRGMAHISVIECLQSLGIKPDLVAGSSIGSMISALYAAGKLDDFKRDFFKMSKAEVIRYFYPAMSRSGLLDADKIISYIERYIPKDAKIEDLNLPLAIVTTDYETGEPVVFRQGNVLTAIRASISIPGVFIPVRYKKSFLVDGGVSNPLPIDVARQMGADIVIAVNLQPSVKHMKKIDEKKIKDYDSSLIAPIPDKYFSAIKDKWKLSADLSDNVWLSKFLSKKEKKEKKKELPNIFEVLLQTIQIMIYHNTATIIEKHKPDVLIEPNLLHVTALDFRESKNALEEGRIAFEKIRPRMLQIIKDSSQ